MQVESQSINRTYLEWSKSLRDTSASRKPLATPTNRKSPTSRMFATTSRQSKPNTEDTRDLSQLQNNTNIKQPKNSDDDVEFEKRDSILSPRICTPIPTQMTDNQSGSRVATDVSHDKSHHDKSHLKGLSDSAYTEDIPQELANQLQNRLSTLEILFS